MSDSQKRLGAIWAKILGRAERMFVPASNFFDEGGDSIKAQEMFFLLKREFTDIDLPITVIFGSPTLEGLARQIDRARDPIGLRLDVNPLPGDDRAEDEAYAADARDLIKKLPEEVAGISASGGADWLAAANGAANGEAHASPNVFLTGATGFLGSFILRELLSRPLGCHVIAHVRAKDTAAARDRIESSCRAYGFWDPKWLDRLDVMTGDISKPQLGLDTASWQRISSWADVVIHNGAQVNWMLPYSSLRAANVLSTLDCIRLCATEGKPKKLVFVSSTSTLDNDYFVQQSREGRPVSEDDDLEGSRKGLATGYGQSKWASEFLVREAGKRGLDGCIVRPGYVTGDPATGVSVTDDFLVRLWKGCLQIGARPDIGNSLNAVPVTRVAEVAVAAAFVDLEGSKVSKQANGVSIAQVNSHPRMSINDWIGAMERYGYEMPAVEYRAWTEKVKKYVSAGEGKDQSHEKEPFALLPLFHYVVGDLPAGTIAPELDDGNARAVVKVWEEFKANAKPTANGSAGDHGKNGTSTRMETVGESEGVTTELLGVYIAYLVAVGFLPAPTKSTADVQPLPKVDEERLRSLAAAGAGGRGSTRS
jgi:L-2-aminoadipate reductase